MSFWLRKKETTPISIGPSKIAVDGPQEGLEQRVGYIDIVDRSRIRGWCWNPGSPEQSLAIEAVGSNGNRAVAIACLFREDVKDAGRGTGFYGFEIDLDGFAGADTIVLRYQDSGELISNEPIALDPMRALLTNDFPQNFKRRTREICHEIRFRHLIDKRIAAPNIVPCDPRLLDTSDKSTDPEGLITRFVAQERFRVGRGLYDAKMCGTIQDRLGILFWYIEYYSSSRSLPAFIPLSEPQIAMLNSPALLSDVDPAVTVALQNLIIRNRQNICNFADLKMLTEAIYWWCIDKAPSLHLEAILVTREQIDFLRCDAIGAGADFPCNLFMVGWHAAHSALHHLDLNLPRDRAALTVHLVLESFLRPDLVRYINNGSLRLLMRTDEKGKPRLDAILSRFADMETTDVGTSAAGAHIRIIGEEMLHSVGLHLVPGRKNQFEAILSKSHEVEPGVALIGPLHKSSGLGHAARLALVALKIAEATKPVASNFDIEQPGPATTAISYETQEAPREITILSLNSEAVPLAFAYGPRAFLKGSYLVGFFFWELNEIPECQKFGLDLVDEIWVASEYNREIYSRVTDKPVIRVGIAALDLPSVVPSARDRYGLYDDSFIFIAVFDSLSFLARKNPIGSIKAFQKAFPLGTEPVQLVLKTQNRALVSDSWQVRTWSSIDRLVNTDPRIVVINETLNVEDLLALVLLCNAYISMHRSEGWGFGLVEAMQLGLPVICTGYSGNMDFCTQETAFIVAHELIPVAVDEYIYVPSGSVWADPSIASAAEHMRHVVYDKKAAAQKTKAAKSHIESLLNPGVISNNYAKRLTEIRERIKRRAN